MVLSQAMDSVQAAISRAQLAQAHPSHAFNALLASLELAHSVLRAALQDTSSTQSPVLALLVLPIALDVHLPPAALSALIHSTLQLMASVKEYAQLEPLQMEILVYAISVSFISRLACLHVLMDSTQLLTESAQCALPHASLAQGLPQTVFLALLVTHTIVSPTHALKAALVPMDLSQMLMEYVRDTAQPAISITVVVSSHAQPDTLLMIMEVAFSRFHQPSVRCLLSFKAQLVCSLAWLVTSLTQLHAHVTDALLIASSVSVPLPV